LVDRDVARFRTIEDLGHIIGHAPRELDKVGRISRQPTRFHVFALRIDRRSAVFLGQCDDQLTVSRSLRVVAHGLASEIAISRE
jgi:hypothetical protein